MPELPEVEYTARQLRATVIGKTIREAVAFWERTIGHPDQPTFLAEVAGRTIIGVRRRGKYLILDLSGKLFLSIHRRMTGNLLLLPVGWEIDTHMREADPMVWARKGPTFRERSQAATYGVTGDTAISIVTKPITQSQTEYCRACFNFTDGERLLFTDLRKFGRIELWSRTQEDEAFADLGPEPLEEAFTMERLAEALAGRRTGIKQALLTQKLVAGIGNIYADEALFYAKIHPLRRSDSLAPEEIKRLQEGIVTVLRNGIEHGGTSFNDYRDLWGEAGDNYNHVHVYQRNGKPCTRCGTPIVRIVVAQRGTHFCPQCQPASKPIQE